MSTRNGDRARANREQQKKALRRIQSRQLRKTLAGWPGAPATRPSAAPRAVSTPAPVPAEAQGE